MFGVVVGIRVDRHRICTSGCREHHDITIRARHGVKNDRCRPSNRQCTHRTQEIRNLADCRLNGARTGARLSHRESVADETAGQFNVENGIFPDRILCGKRPAQLIVTHCRIRRNIDIERNIGTIQRNDRQREGILRDGTFAICGRDRDIVHGRISVLQTRRAGNNASIGIESDIVARWQPGDRQGQRLAVRVREGSGNIQIER